MVGFSPRHGSECRLLKLAGGGSGRFDFRAGVERQDVLDVMVDVHARELGPEDAFRGLHARHTDADLITERKGVIEQSLLGILCELNGLLSRLDAELS